MSEDAWEKLRQLTLDQIVTHTKLAGSAMHFAGRTTPEGWPFVLVVAVGKPGNELAVTYANEFIAKMSAAARTRHGRNREADH